MENNICSFCEKHFSTKYSVKRHEENCKKKQNVNKINKLEKENTDINEPYEKNVKKCENCEKLFSSVYNLNRHQEICKDINMLLKENKSLKQKISKNLQRINELTSENKSQFNIIETYKKTELEYKDKIEKLEETIEKLACKAIENTGSKTTTINNNRNQIYNALQPLTNEHMRDQTKYLTSKVIKNGVDGIAHFASQHTFKDRLFCSDVSRLNFVFKNENDVIIKDPEGIEVTKRFIEINRDELLRLLEEYYNFIISELDKASDTIEYRHWASRREEIISIRSAVKRGNIPENKESYDEFKKNFLSVLSELVPR